MANNFWRLTLDTNPEDCNLACVMCEEHSPFSDFKERLYARTGKKVRRMPAAWLEPIFKEAAELGVREIIPSTMGEPLLYQNIDQIFELCKTYNIKCNLTTNGTFPKRSVEDWAQTIIPVTSDVKISWNGATKATSELVMQKIDFTEAVENVQRFVAVRDKIANDGGNFCRITFQLTFMRNNMHELADIIKLAAQLGVDRVKGHQLWVHFDELESLTFRKDAATIREWNKYVKAAWEAAEKYRKPNGEKALLEQVTPLAENFVGEVRVTDECPFLEKELWISATGKISPCCAPDELRKELGNFGTYPETKIKEAIFGESYGHLAQNYKEQDLCKGCTMRKPIGINKILN